jgi:hypothetical protein
MGTFSVLAPLFSTATLLAMCKMCSMSGPYRYDSCDKGTILAGQGITSRID